MSKIPGKIPKIDRQREHQANERTFLAWLRTSISLIGFGFAIARFGLFMRQLNFALTQQEPLVNPIFNSEKLGTVFVVFGIVAIALAAWRYNQVFWEIERGDYRPHRLPMWIMTGVVIILGILSLPLLLLGNRGLPRPSSRHNQTESRHFW
ncbi:YidH family protein [Umezakia ovalisporum]|uniref:YidH family protein n=1 Tax=Umezakia ovalisporum TaxID=75695 RepID=UPI00247515EC|nr:DUF202 domain-containing protein [Umezakia ovalisporum]MDH6083356.1 DUF202 domain-containing protein [Umezakia ovalisporum TAC611]